MYIGKINNIKSSLTRAKKDLNFWLKKAGVKTTKEFFNMQNKIKKESYHNYNDVLEHLKYIKKIEKVLKKIENGIK